MAGNIDMIADVLKQLKVTGKANVTQTQADEAARQYNDIVKELKNARQFCIAHGECSQQTNRTQVCLYMDKSSSLCSVSDISSSRLANQSEYPLQDGFRNITGNE